MPMATVSLPVRNLTINNAYQDVSKLDLCVGEEKFAGSIKGIEGLKGSRAGTNKRHNNSAGN